MAKERLHPKSIQDKVWHYCPGCSHGIVHRIIGEVIDELNIQKSVIGIASVGCSYNNYEYFNFDVIQAAHGRAPAVATGVKRVLPNNVVFTYQGDGDLAAIGTAEIIHVAARGERLTTIFINNAIYGMTSGQMAPTTLPEQITKTTPVGRNTDYHGFPIRISEMLALQEGTAFVERVSTHDVKHIIKAKKAIKKAFMVQQAGLGFSLVEVLSTCPTNWGLTPLESQEWIKDHMIPYYGIGNLKGKDIKV